MTHRRFASPIASRSTSTKPNRSRSAIPASCRATAWVLRLARGDFARVTRHAIDPVAYARELRGRAPRLHVIDLDAARGGRLAQVRLIREVCAAFGGPVQVGGGVRGPEDIAVLHDAGAARVIVGTAAARDPSFVRRLAIAHPGALVVALDTRGGRIAVEGWQASSLGGRSWTAR